jgi:hypothetical protein
VHYAARRYPRTAPALIIGAASTSSPRHVSELVEGRRQPKVLGAGVDAEIVVAPPYVLDEGVATDARTSERVTLRSRDVRSRVLEARTLAG